MATAVKSDNKKKEVESKEVELKEAPQENPAAPEAPAILPTVADSNDTEALIGSRAKAAALVSIAETRAHRAAKLVETGDMEALKNEVGAVEDLLKKVARELA